MAEDLDDAVELESVDALGVLPWSQSLLVFDQHTHSLLFAEVFDVQGSIALAYCGVVEQGVATSCVLNINICLPPVAQDLH